MDGDAGVGLFASAVRLPSLIRGLTTRCVAVWVPVGAQLAGMGAPVLPAKLHRLTVISPENSGFTSGPMALPLLVSGGPPASEVFWSVSVATIPLSTRSSPVSM